MVFDAILDRIDYFIFILENRSEIIKSFFNLIKIYWFYTTGDYIVLSKKFNVVDDNKYIGVIMDTDSIYYSPNIECKILAGSHEVLCVNLLAYARVRKATETEIQYFRVMTGL